MGHLDYSPVGYSFIASDYCLDCIPGVLLGDNLPVYTQDDGCNCAECVLDRAGDDRGIDRYDEGSYDSSYFPKSIPYHNDLHSECGPESYGYGPEDPEWQEQYCSATCSKCHEVIDGVSELSGPDVCPTFAYRKENEEVIS